MGWTRLTGITACSALLLSLSACGGDPEPKFTKAPSPSTSVSASVSPSPTPSEPTPPEMPAAARHHTVAGAKAFVRYFWRAGNYSQRTLDPSPIRPLLSKGCDGCQGALDAIERLAKAHATVRGGKATVSHMRTERLLAGRTQLVRVTYALTSTRQIVRYPRGKKDDVYPAGTVTDTWVLSPRQPGWMIISWDVRS